MHFKSLESVVVRLQNRMLLTLWPSCY